MTNNGPPQLLNIQQRGLRYRGITRKLLLDSLISFDYYCRPAGQGGLQKGRPARPVSDNKRIA